MADPICRWRNPYIATLVELIQLLPKEELSQERAREIVTNTYPDFFRTPYQLACQLGLYHETNGRYFPKFTFSPSEEEINDYLTNWIVHYCIPNPYTRGFDGVQPFSIHSEICRRLLEGQRSLNWELVKDAIFREPIGNNDILVNSINTYSPIISVTDGIVELKEDKTYAELEAYINVDINTDRNNKEYFFDLFSLPNQNIESQQNENDGIITTTNRQEIEIINQLQINTNFTQTEKNQIIAARIGQGYFRRNLIYNCGFCPITQVDDSRFLIASHIKPWLSSTNEERLSVQNGFLFTPTYDKLFDKGYISFTNDKRIIISPLISNDNKDRFNLVEGTEYPLLPTAGREIFLEYHRVTILKT
jgi:hypothetical protein